MSAQAPGGVAVLIPCFREEKHIRSVAQGALKMVSRVLVVDDGSEDRTFQEAQASGAEALRHVQNAGKGAAIKTGLRQLLSLNHSHIILMDGDGQHRWEEIGNFLATLSCEPALVLGNRMADTRGMPLLRRFVNRLMSLLVSVRCGQHIPDSQCGFRMLHRDLARTLVEQTHTNAYEFETEMLLLAAREGHRIISVPVSTVYADEASTIRPVRDALAFIRLYLRFPR